MCAQEASTWWTYFCTLWCRCWCADWPVKYSISTLHWHWLPPFSSQHIRSIVKRYGRFHFLFYSNFVDDFSFYSFHFFPSYIFFTIFFPNNKKNPINEPVSFFGMGGWLVGSFLRFQSFVSGKLFLGKQTNTVNFLVKKIVLLVTM